MFSNFMINFLLPLILFHLYLTIFADCILLYVQKIYLFLQRNFTDNLNFARFRQIFMRHTATTISINIKSVSRRCEKERERKVKINRCITRPRNIGDSCKNRRVALFSLFG